MNGLDELLMRRRALEFEVFEKIEKEHVMPLIKDGFSSVDEFIKLALSISNRRKSRTGKSLELNLADIFQGSRLLFQQNEETENKKKPDFIFPSIDAYFNDNFPAEKLIMLGTKTTLKDRWRQVLSEADRIRKKHLFTLQEGVSENQFAEMKASNLTLVAPKKTIAKYPKSTRNNILTLDDFVSEVRSIQN